MKEYNTNKEEKPMEKYIYKDFGRTCFEINEKPQEIEKIDRNSYLFNPVLMNKLDELIEAINYLLLKEK